MKHLLLGALLLTLASATCVAQVTSVSIAVPSWLKQTGSPITGSGTITISPNTGQSSHLVIGTCGLATTFTPCALLGGDLPTATASTQGAVTVPASAVVLGSNGSSVLGAASTTGSGTSVVLAGDPTLVSAIVAPAAISGTPSGTAGNAFQVSAATFTDNATAGGGTAPAYAASTVSQPTLTASAASTVTTTTASTVSISGAVLAGTKELITNSVGLNIAAGSSVAPSGTVTNAYGLFVNPPTGATNNYAAGFAGQVLFSASTSSAPSLIVPAGAAVTSPPTGSVWENGNQTNFWDSVQAGGGASTPSSVGFTCCQSGSNYTYVVYPNDTLTGTCLNCVVFLTGSQKAQQTPAGGTTDLPIGVCIQPSPNPNMYTCGKTGNAAIAVSGIVQVAIDNAYTANHLVGISTSAGKATDLGAFQVLPGAPATATLGSVWDASGTSSPANILLNIQPGAPTIPAHQFLGNGSGQAGSAANVTANYLTAYDTSVQATAADTGMTSNAYVIAPNGGITSYTGASGACLQFTITMARANTGAATLQPNGLAAKSIYFQGAALVGGELSTTDPNTVCWNSATATGQWVLQHSSATMTNNNANALTANGTVNASAASATAGLIEPVAAAAAPASSGAMAVDSTQLADNVGIGGTTLSRVLAFPVVTSTTDIICALHSDTIGLGACSNTVTDGSTETEFASTVTIPSSFMQTGKALKVKVLLGFTSSTPSPPYIQMKLKWGGTPGSTPGGVTVYSTGTTPPTANLTNSGLMMDCTVVSTGVPGAAVNTYTECNVPFPAWDFVAQRNIVAQPKSVATNASKTIGVSITYGANTSGNAVQLQALIVEVVR